MIMVTTTTSQLAHTTHMPFAIPSIVAEIPIEEKQMMTSFIQQQIDMGIHNIIHQLSKQLADIVKPMVHNEVTNCSCFRYL